MGSTAPVLVVDDLVSVELLTAPTAESGLPLIRAHQPAVVIMDINLPGMSGFDAARQLHDWPETTGIPIVGLSAAALRQGHGARQERWLLSLPDQAGQSGRADGTPRGAASWSIKLMEPTQPPPSRNAPGSTRPASWTATRSTSSAGARTEFLRPTPPWRIYVPTGSTAPQCS
jgi:CheY-like chemotaxis protein